MPTWSLEELEACRQRLYLGVAADTAAERYSWLGGSIRHVLGKVDTDPEQMLRAAVHKGSAQGRPSATSPTSPTRLGTSR
jgi:hypothetical protein